MSPSSSHLPGSASMKGIVARILAAIDESGEPAAMLRNAVRRPSRMPRAVLAMGKASVPLAGEAMRVWGDSIVAGLVVTLDNEPLPSECRRVFRAVRGSHPEPTWASVAAGAKVCAFVDSLEQRAILTVLLSGGASAQAVSLRGGLTAEHAAEIFRRVSRAGGTIEELNTIRRHIDAIKGGGLAERFRGRIESYVLSDVIGDPLHVIGSGPTAPDPTTFADALAVLRKYRLLSAVPAVTRWLKRSAAGAERETRKRAFGPRVRNTVIGNNERVVGAIAAAMREMGVRVAAKHAGVTGEAAPLGRVAARAAKELAAAKRPGCMIWGGEWTVTVGQSGGLGGPSQEAALAAAIELAGSDGVAVFTFSTDGIDGPTPHAGAVVDGGTVARMIAKGVIPERALRRHDSTPALAAAGGLVSPGATGTNLNHIVVAIAVPTLEP